MAHDDELDALLRTALRDEAAGTDYLGGLPEPVFRGVRRRKQRQVTMAAAGGATALAVALGGWFTTQGVSPRGGDAAPVAATATASTTSPSTAPEPVPAPVATTEAPSAPATTVYATVTTVVTRAPEPEDAPVPEDTPVEASSSPVTTEEPTAAETTEPAATQAAGVVPLETVNTAGTSVRTVDGDASFASPTGNTVCAMKAQEIFCQVMTHRYVADPKDVDPNYPGCDSDALADASGVRFRCRDGITGAVDATSDDPRKSWWTEADGTVDLTFGVPESTIKQPVLPYGTSLTTPSGTCRMDREGVTCWYTGGGTISSMFMSKGAYAFHHG